MDNTIGRQVRRRTANQEAGAKAELPIANRDIENPMFVSDLMEVVCDRDNLRAVLKRVRSNKCSPGVDGMAVNELAENLRVHWPQNSRKITYYPHSG
jgi:hypothetical protein